METIEIKGQLRKEIGKKDSKKLRSMDHVPCVIYGSGEENVHFHAHENDFRNLVYTPNTYLVNLDIDGTKHNVVMKDLQFHPVTDKINHIDFLRFKESEKVKVEIPVKTFGFSIGVKDGGVLMVHLRKVSIAALPKDLPEIINIDIENLELGKSIKVRDLKFDENLETLNPPNTLVCDVKMTRVAKSMAEEELEEGEGEEGEEGTEEKTTTE